MTLRKGRVLLLDCGHGHSLPQTITRYCEECQLHGPPSRDEDPFLRGYLCGIAAQLDVDQQDLERLGQAWLNHAKDIGHVPSCLCQSCLVAKRILAQKTAGLLRSKQNGEREQDVAKE